MNQANKKNIRKALLLSMERVIARSCYNGSIRNYGAWGVQESDGRFFRYPLTVFNKDSKDVKSKNPDVGMSLEGLKSSFYQFGKNELHVIEALDFILTSLEEEYGLNIYQSTETRIPDSYKLLKPETIFEAEACMGATGGGWNFNKPSLRDVYESPEGVRYALIKDILQPIRSPSEMQEIVESCAVNENLWHRFESPRLDDKKFHSFVEFGDSQDIAKLHALMRSKKR